MLSIIVPVRDESDSLKDILDYFSKNLININYEVLIINDFSKDNTLENARNLFDKSKNFKVFDNKTKGLGGAINLGIKESEGINVAIVMADRSDDNNDLIKYNELMNSGNYDAILGSRFLKDSKVAEYPIRKLILNRIFNFFVGLIQTLPIIIVSYGVGLGIEMGFAQFRGHPVNEGFLVTGMLIPLCMPPDVPLWMVGLATAFSVVIGKEVFGGTGMNLLNPALTARMFLYIGYPSSMSGDSVWTFLPEGSKTVDGYSGATNLGELASATAEGKPWSDDILSASIMDSFWGNIQGSIGETSVVACLIGAVILISAGVGSWKIMVSTILGGLFMGWIFNISGADGAYMDMPAYYHLIIGGFMFGAIFMTTDPVSAAQTEKGKWIYGFLIGVLTVLIRVFNPGYPEGIMMAILLMNVFAPLIDYYVVQSNIKTRLNRVKV